MKILVLSDSHGNLDNMVRAVETVQPRLIIHLGDCWGDALRLQKRFPNIPMEQVPGNCDYRSMEEPERLLFLEDKRVLICHGHTHRPLVDMRGKTLFINPGSIGDYFHPFYAVVTIENGKVDGHTWPLEG